MDDKAYIVMKKVRYDVIQKGKKVTKKLHKVIEHFILFLCAFKKMKKYTENFFGYFFSIFQ